ncbi:MAG TPA: tetratricopeptide repeat protein [Mucilaginibacter sp.]|nr:tetratricopeptide repeat protein [Mucilaginibacter sp.]
MKMKLLMTCLLGIASVTAFAQKGELKDAQSNYDTYSGLRSAKAGPLKTKADASLKDAQTAIDKAASNNKTANMPQTYALKAAIYSALAAGDTVASTSAPLFATADEAVAKAKELDSKNEYKTLIDDANINLAQYKLTAGVKDYQNKKYEDAYKEFDYYRTKLPTDTNAIYYTALAATNAADAAKDPKYYKLALDNYANLVKTNYTGAPKAYLDMSSIYLILKDTTNAIKISEEGIAKFPGDASLRKREIEIALQSGKQNDVLSKIQSAIANDPKNKELYYYLGLTYVQLADADDAKSNKEKNDDFHAKAVANYAKAADAYKKALEIDPDYFEANMNLGYALMKPALDIYNAAQLLPTSKQKEYDAAMAKSDAMLDLAKPYLQKAVDLKPKDIDALTNLRSYYRGKSDKATAAENKAKAAELKKQIDAVGAGGN